MTTPLLQSELPLTTKASTDPRVFLNSTLWFVDADGYRVVFCRHEPIYRVALDDQPHIRFVAVMIRQSELATQQELARTFDHSVASQRRWERQYQEFGLEGLEDHFSPGRPRKLGTAQERFVRRWFLQGLTKSEMARRLGVGETTVSRTCERLGLRRQPTPEPELPLDAPLASAPASLSPSSADSELPSPLDQELHLDELILPTPRKSIELDDLVAPKTQLSDTQTNPVPTAAIVADPDLPNPVSAAATVAAPNSSNFAQHSDTQTNPASAEAIVAAPDLPSPAEPPPPPLTPATGSPLPVRQPQAVSATFTLDTDPLNREGDRLLARQGLLTDALPLFASGERLPRAGILLAVPVLVNHGVLPAFTEVYGSLHPSFYGLRTMVTTLLFMALLRIKHPENIKEYSPEDIGRLLGLDRAPEVKTVRRKLAELAAFKKGKPLLEALAKARIARQGEALAFLYIDGHVREYHGQEALPKTKKPQSPVARSATTDYWVHDAVGSPLLVVNSEMNAAMTQVLEPILAQVKTLLPQGQRLTVIFDRGGFSARLFKRLIDKGVDVITYRKGKKRLLAKRCFSEHQLVIDGRTITYQLCDQPKKRVGRLREASKDGVRRKDDPPQFLWLREVTVLRKEGKQTQVLTSRKDLEPACVLYRMFGRWCQENFFKYMEAEFALDALAEYGVEDTAPQGDRPNPQRRKVQKRLAKAKAEVARLQQALGKTLFEEEGKAKKTQDEVEAEQAALLKQLREAEARELRLRKKLRRLPKRVTASDLKVLKRERRYVVDGIKMTAYQLETQLLGMLQEHYPRTQDEGRTFLQAAFQTSGRLEVTPGELRVTLARQSSPHRSRALADLCNKLNALDTCFPGTDLRLRLAVEPHDPLTP